MGAFFSDIMDVFAHYLKGILIALIGFVVLILVLYGVAEYKTTDSEGCNSCHFMDPYVRHWEESSHASIDCIACHDYSGGDLMLSTIQYVANVYDNRPKADVPDENCLSSDCHSMDQLGEGIEFKKGI